MHGRLAVLATGIHEPRPVDHRSAPAPAGGLGHAPGHLPLYGGRGDLRRQDPRGAGRGGPAPPGARRRRQRGSRDASGAARRLGLGAGARHGQVGVPPRSEARSPAQAAEGCVHDRGGRGRRGKRVRRAGRGRRAVVSEGLDGARRKAPHLDRRGDQRLPVAFRPAGGGRGCSVRRRPPASTHSLPARRTRRSRTVRMSAPCRGSAAGFHRSPT